MRASIRKALLSGAALAAVSCAAGAAFAQDQTGAKDSTSAPQEITVTGSRVRSTFTTPTPVTVITTQQLQKASPGNLVEAVNQLPEFYNSSTNAAPAPFFVSPGAGNFNLRSLGSQRTLTLLDGRRVVSSTRYGGTDSNTFPKEMIKSVEAVTGGASAAYGTDAISGVVNFILDTSFTGVRGHLQGGITSRGDGKNWEGSIAAGTDIGDKIHVLASFEQEEQNPIYTYAGRDWYQSWGLITGPAGGPTFLKRPHVVSTSASLDGIFTIAGTQYQFNPNGSFSPFNAVPAGQGTIGSGNQNYVQPVGGSGTDIGADRPTVLPATDRQSAFGYIEYNPWDNLKIFAQGIYGKNDTTSTNIGGSLTQGSPATIFSGNAFLPAGVQTLLTNAGAASFVLNKLGSALDTAQDAFVLTHNRMTSLTSGFKYDFLHDGMFGGDWFRNWRANGYFQYGHTTYNAQQRGGFRLDRIQLALDAVKDAGGNIVCRVNLPQYKSVNGGRWSDCVPINLFGRGQASQAAIDWVTGYDPGQHIGPATIVYTNGSTATDAYDTAGVGDKIAAGDIVQKVTEITLDGDIWEGWGAGAISGAIGY
ncbi:MAG TPA: TonB-dependent receptor plug domain-containing protein, partial [Pseudolabrys sp.]|nr:TonB-dependent receptor plug domain-containing protein [Pseudolabrys sp.]